MGTQTEKQSHQLTISGNYQLRIIPTKADSVTGKWGKEIWKTTVLLKLLWSLVTILPKTMPSGEERERC